MKIKEGRKTSNTFSWNLQSFSFLSLLLFGARCSQHFQCFFGFYRAIKKEKEKQPHHHYFRSRYLKSFQIESTWLSSRWLVNWAFLFRFHGVAVKHPNRLLIIPLSLNNRLLLALILNMNYITVLHCAWADCKPNKQP